MDNFGKYILLLSIVTGGAVAYDSYTPPAAAWYAEGKLTPHQEIMGVAPPSPLSTLSSNTYFIPNKVNTPTEPSVYGEGYADFVKTPIPIMDDYPKSPEEAEALERKKLGMEPVGRQRPSNLVNLSEPSVNFGLLK